MKKIFVAVLLLLPTATVMADESPILYQCKSLIEPARAIDLLHNEKNIQISSFKGQGMAKRTLRSAILDSLSKATTNSGYFCSPEKYLSNELLMEWSWQSIDLDEKFLIANCKYLCEETSL